MALFRQHESQTVCIHMARFLSMQLRPWEDTGEACSFGQGSVVPIPGFHEVHARERLLLVADILGFDRAEVLGGVRRADRSIDISMMDPESAALRQLLKKEGRKCFTALYLVSACYTEAAGLPEGAKEEQDLLEEERDELGFSESLFDEVRAEQEALKSNLRFHPQLLSYFEGMRLGELPFPPMMERAVERYAVTLERFKEDRELSELCHVPMGVMGPLPNGPFMAHIWGVVLTTYYLG